jgi:hypothetical protein
MKSYKWQSILLTSIIVFFISCGSVYAQFRIPNPSICSDMACVFDRLATTARQLAIISFTVMFAYGAFLYIMAGDNDDQITKARTLMIGAVTGIVLIFAAPGLTNFALSIFRTTFLRT